MRLSSVHHHHDSTTVVFKMCTNNNAMSKRESKNVTSEHVCCDEKAFNRKAALNIRLVTIYS